MLDDARRVKVGDLAIKAGRPLLIVPYGISALTLKNAFVAWKDSPEARRAVADAMPLLKLTPSPGVTICRKFCTWIIDSTDTVWMRVGMGYVVAGAMISSTFAAPGS